MEQNRPFCMKVVGETKKKDCERIEKILKTDVLVLVVRKNS